MTLTIERMVLNPPRRGGTVKLLRMAKVRCGAAMSFAALWAPDGTPVITVHPEPDDMLVREESLWRRTEIEQLAQEAWRELNQHGHSALSQRASASGTAALAPLVDPGPPHRALGVLGVVRLAAEPFGDQELSALQIMAGRMVAHLRAQDEILLRAKATAPHAEATAPHTEATARRAGSQSHGEAIVLPSSLDTLRPLVEHLRSVATGAPQTRRGVVFIHVAGGRTSHPGAIGVAANILRRNVRGEDLVVPVGDSTLAVVLCLPDELETANHVQHRLTQAVEAAVGFAGESRVRSSSVCIPSDLRDGEEPLSEILHRAWTPLRST